MMALLKRSVPFGWAGLMAFALFGAAGCGVEGKPVPLQRLVPAKPARLKADVIESGVRVHFQVPTRYTNGTPLKDLDRFEVFRGDQPPGDCKDCPPEMERIGEIPYEYPEGRKLPRGRVEYIDKGVSPGAYVYYVKTVNRRGIKSVPSSRAKVYWDTPPRKPKILEALGGDSRVELVWAPVTERTDGKPLGVVRYQVFREEKGKGFRRSPINSTPLEETRFVDTDVVNERVYVYKVQAVRPVGDQWVPGQASEPVEATPEDLIPPRPPQGLVAFQIPTGIRLVWVGGDQPDVKGYLVYRAEAEGGPWAKMTPQGIMGVAFEDNTAEQGKWYWYAVTALDDATPPNESLRSQPVKARIFPK